MDETKCNLEGRYNGGIAQCDLPTGHEGPHKEHWIDRNNRRLVNLAWTHMRNGDIVFPHVKGAVRV